MGEENLFDDFLKEILRTLKSNKSSGYDITSSNVVRETSDILFTALKIYFQSFVTTENISGKKT